MKQIDIVHLIWACIGGVYVAILYSFYSKAVLGKTVTALLEAGATNEEKAVSLDSIRRNNFFVGCIFVAEEHIVFDCSSEKHCLLRNYADLCAKFIVGNIIYVITLKQHLSLTRFIETRNEIYEGCFSRTC